jgi:hypothetical protein
MCEAGRYMASGHFHRESYLGVIPLSNSFHLSYCFPPFILKGCISLSCLPGRGGDEDDLQMDEQRGLQKEV